MQNYQNCYMWSMALSSYVSEGYRCARVARKAIDCEDL